MRLKARGASCAVAAMVTSAVVGEARAVDIPDVAGETLTLDISNTSEIAYHFDNRDITTAGTDALKAEEHVNDNYGEWLNRLYLRAYYWKMSLGVRLDSAVYFNTLDRQDAQDLIEDELGAPDLTLENRFGREIHSRYTSMLYPAKLWVGFKHKRLEATVGDFYAHLGRGIIFSVRKIDEVGIDTTVRGGKLKYGHKFDGGFRIDAGVFGGQMNPIRIDFPTGRILHGSGSPLFFGFPVSSDFRYFGATGQPPPDEFVEQVERAKPSYLEDNVIGGNISFGPKWAQLEANAAVLFRQSNSEDQVRCIEGGGDPDQCRADNPSFSVPEASRSRDQIRNFGGALKIPPIADTVDMYFEGAGQHATDGRVTGFEEDGSVIAESDTHGYAIYGNVNFTLGPVSTTLEGKHYHNYLLLGGNIDNADLAFGAREYNIVTYNRPPNIESIYTEPIGSPDVCATGGRARVDLTLADPFHVFGWAAHIVSFTEIDPSLERDDASDPDSALTCTPGGSNDDGVDRSSARRTNTWDMAAGSEIELQEGKTFYRAHIGARHTDREVPVVNPAIGTESATFYRENYIRYDFNQHLAGAFSLSALGHHRRRLEPDQIPTAWHEGENLLALNWSPHFSFIFGHEYQTRPGLPVHYFNGAIQYRSKSQDEWYDQLTDMVRVYIGQRRAALRCVGGVCRIFPAFEGVKAELVSRF